MEWPWWVGVVALGALAVVIGAVVLYCLAFCVVEVVKHRGLPPFE